MKETVKIGIIGLGRWGTNYFRTFNEIENCEVKSICASHSKTLSEAIKKINPAKKPGTSTSCRDMLDDRGIDAVVIATNGASHYSLAKEALEAGKHVIVEKPVAFSSKDVGSLISISKRKSRVFMAGHQHLYNPGIQKLNSDIGKGLFGKINFIHMAHFGNGPIRTDMSALWDFFPHSVSILLHLLKKSPISISASGQSFINRGIEDIVAMNAKFPGKTFAVSLGSWLYPVKKMNIAVVGEKLHAVFDDYAENKLFYYSNGNTSNIPISSSRPLTNELIHFIDCIKNNKKPLTDGNEALKVTKVLEAAQKSLGSNGRPMSVKD